MLSAQAKWPFGHFEYPCNPHGRQESAWLVSIILLLSDRGVKPKAGMVEQKMAVTGALTEEARCMGAESLTKFIFAFCIRAAEPSKDNCPATLCTSWRALCSRMYWQASKSDGAPSRNTVWLGGSCWINSIHLCAGHCLVNHTEVGAMQK